MLKYRLPSRTGIFQKSLEWELRKLRQELTASKTDGYRGLVARAMTSFKKFIVSLGDPRFAFEPIHIGNNTVSRDYYNRTRKTIEQDLIAAEEDVTNLGHAAIESFNVAQTLAKELEGLAALAGSKAQDIAVLAQGAATTVLVAGDSFDNRNQVDSSFALTMPSAYVDVRQGLVTLSREEAESLLDPERVKISVEPQGVTRKTQDYKENTGRFYEGRYYALAGQAEPEGGRWHIEELTSKAPDDGFYYEFEKWATDTAGRNYARRGWTYDGAEASVNPIGAYVDQNGNLVVRNEIILRDRGATEAELNAVRLRMIDGNPDTYWQCEYVLKPSSFGSTPSVLPGERGQVYAVAGAGATFGDNNAKMVPGSQTDLRGTYTMSGTVNDARLSVTPEDLRQTAADLDSMDLEIHLLITLPEPVHMNWLNLLPMNFGETAWLKITDIATSEQRNGIWSTIPGFVEGRTQNTLTEDVNSELLDSTAEHIMSPSKFTYRGNGIWTFPTRKVQVIRIKIKQEVPTPVLYQKIQIQMHREWSRDYRYTYNSDSRSLRSDEIEIAEWTKVITLDYLRSVAIMQGSLSADEVAPSTLGTNSSSLVNQDRTVDNSTRDNWLNFHSAGLYNLFGGGGNHNRSSSSGINENDTGYYMNGYWVETFYDYIGYRIGVREISCYRNVYQTSSEIVSRPFYSPTSIKKVTLQVDASTPDGTSIEYYVSPDKGKTWNRINPLDKPSIYGEDGYAVPRTISFNIPGNPGNESKYVQTEQPVRQLLFRAVLRSDASDDSPLLRAYRLLMYPAEALNPPEAAD